jgi:hypothetical protein
MASRSKSKNISRMKQMHPESTGLHHETNEKIPFHSAIGCCRQLDLVFSWTTVHKVPRRKFFFYIGPGGYGRNQDRDEEWTASESHSHTNLFLLIFFPVHHWKKFLQHVAMYRSTLVYPGLLKTKRIITSLSPSDCGNAEIFQAQAEIHSNPPDG